ncbi:Slg1p NDAI_0E03660 [Naumovozyma dairenensis CBS 421]|uniref:WSC domain-containing protein n=1 Tax=Naumovozyma dairenensis (strain ATCC 10597 / BCRC 20456 / CBS 421 / NBRC 0211 / NRRL Y-12639) TaxID=1071378 RepID=G0WBR3_NAUDC|nr:hypothetical protein NDAI_0E03660 [Naumovozyma dairenensis CBS 421]CCD25183.1 hypothetical protein NDAI_0E03660 [Naumovozyma dairenensis CBS 421]
MISRKLTISLLTLFYGIKDINTQDTTTGYTYLNCYGSIPSGFTLYDSYAYQSSSHCYTNCLANGSQYFALTNHADCYCGNQAPSSSDVSSSCNTNCNGYGQEMCGGEDAFSVYTIDSDDDNTGTSNDAVSSPTTTTSTSSTRSITSSSTTTTSHFSSSTFPTSISTTSTLLPNPQTSSTTSTTSSISSANSIINSGTTTQEQATTSVSETVAVVYQTAYNTEGGSTVFVTNTITQSYAATGLMNNNSSSSNMSKDSKNKKKTNVGAIVGGVVGGVVGAIVVAIGILLLIRHINVKREEARMEKEYQEAIKPVEFNDYDTTATTSGGGFDDLGFENKDVAGGVTITNDNNGNKNVGDVIYSNSISRSQHPLTTTDSGSFLDDLRVPPNMVSNPFDDSRRISNGSILHGPASHGGKTLTVVNPDETD